MKSISCHNDNNGGEADMTFGNRVRDIRKQKNITQEKLAKELDFKHASAISFIENGKDWMLKRYLL